MREDMDDRNSGRPHNAFKLNERLKQYLLFTLCFNIFFDILFATGMWEYEGIKNNVDLGITMVKIFLPIFGAVFLMILDSEE